MNTDRKNRVNSSESICTISGGVYLMTPGNQNSLLPNLHDIILPDVVPYVPQTVGWYVLAGIILVLAAWSGYRLYQHSVRNRYRKQAFEELARIEDSIKEAGAGGQVRGGDLDQIAVLLKRTALAAFPREKVAGLSGDIWLKFLDQSAGITGFQGPAGRTLLEAAYGAPSELDDIPESSTRELIVLVRNWIKQH
jgi:hypothetical protein